MMRAIGHARAHAPAGDVAVLVDDDHAGRHDIDLIQASPFRCHAFGDAAARPVRYLRVETGAENDTVAGTPGDAQGLRSLRGNVDRHEMLAGFELDVAAGALLTLRHSEAAVVKKIVDDAKTLLEIDELGRGSPETVNRTVTGAHTDDRAALGNFIQRREGIRSNGRIAINHVGHGGAEANSLCIHGAQRHGLIGIDIVHLAVGEKDRFKAERFGADCAIHGFVNRARRTMQAEIHGLFILALGS